MRPTLIADCTDCNAVRCRFSEHVAPVQAGTTRHNPPEHDHLNEQAEATILAVLAAVICASLSVGLVIGVGICRTLGAR